MKNVLYFEIKGEKTLSQKSGEQKKPFSYLARRHLHFFPAHEIKNSGINFSPCSQLCTCEIPKFRRPTGLFANVEPQNQEISELCAVQKREKVSKIVIC